MHELVATPGAAGIRRSSLYRNRFYLVDTEGNTIDTLTKDEAAGIIADDDMEFAS